MDADLRRFLLGFSGVLVAVMLCTAAWVIPARNHARAEELRYYVPQADPLFRALWGVDALADTRLLVFGTSRAESGFNPSLYQSLSGARAFNFGTAGASLAGSSPVIEEVARRWAAPRTSASQPSDALFSVAEDELAFIERRLSRYACGGVACFELWRGAPLAEIAKQEAAWVERGARIFLGWDLRPMAQATLSHMGRPRHSLSDEECTRFDDAMSAETASHIPPQTYCARGYVMNPTNIPPKYNPSSPLPAWETTRAEPMSGLNLLSRQITALRAAGAQATVLIFDAADREVQASTLAATRAAIPGTKVCRFRPGRDGYFDAQHLSAIAAARLTRVFATQALRAPGTALPPVGVSCD